MVKDIDTVISDLELNIDWIKNIPSHQFPGWGNVVNAMKDAKELIIEYSAREGANND